MTTNEIKNGSEVKINGRTYTVKQNFPIGQNTANACPWLDAQYGIEGKKGAVAMMQVFKNGTGRLLFITSCGSRVENFIEAEVTYTGEVLGYTISVEKLLAAAQ